MKATYVRFAAIAAVVLTAACGDPYLPTLGFDRSSEGVTSSRVADLRQTTRFFRLHGAEPSAPMRVGNETLFFASRGLRCTSCPAQTEALFSTDGTRAGTVAVADLGSASWSDAQVLGNWLYFTTSTLESSSPLDYVHRLHRTRGLAAPPAEVALQGEEPMRLVRGDGSLFLLTSKAENNGLRVRLKRLTHVTGSQLQVTVLWEKWIADLAPSPQITANAAGCLLELKGTIVLSDGTVAGTRVLAEGRTVSHVASTPSGLYFVEPGNSASLLFDIVMPSGVATASVRGYGALAINNFDSTHVQATAVVGNTLMLFTKGELWTANASNGVATALVRPWDAAPHWTDFNGKLAAIDKIGKLIVTDGTSAGTTPLLWSAAASDLIMHEGRLHLLTSGASGAAGRQIARWNTSNAMLEYVSAFPGGAELERLRSLDGALYVSAGGSEKELWLIDSTPEMLEANPNGNASSNPQPLAATAQHVFFSIDEDVVTEGLNQTLWVTDGTASGTRELRTGDYGFYDPKLPSPSARAAVADDWACFVEWDGSQRNHVCSDGSATGTQSFPMGAPIAPLALDGAIYLFTSHGLATRFVRLDGSTGVAEVLATLPAGATVTRLVARDADLVFFVDSNGTSVANTVRRIWRSNGTPSGTLRMVADAPVVSAKSVVLGRIGETLFVLANKDLHYQYLLYRTDATATGTSLVEDIGKSPGSFPSGAVIGNRVVFTLSGGHIWVTDGTSAGTASLYVPPGGSAPDWTDVVQTPAGAAFGGPNGRLAMTDGTVAGTRGYASPGLKGYLRFVDVPGRGVVISSFDTKKMFLWNGGATITELEPNRPTAINGHALAVPGGLYFNGHLEGHGYELLYTDATVGGVDVALEAAPGVSSSEPGLPVKRGDKIFVAATDASGDRELWKR